MLFVTSDAGVLYALTPSSMTQAWQYAAGATAATPPAFSSSRNLVVFVTRDLNVHAVNASNGSLKWKVKPTPRSYECTSTSGDACNVTLSSGAQADNGWPVIADQHGLVFVRYRLDWNTLWTWSPFPTTNAAIRSNFQSQPNQQPLFALSLDSGAQSFIPAVGNGGPGDGNVLPMGPQPVVSVLNGQEVAYVPWRNGQLDPASNGNDGRGDFHVGEMELDSSTASGYSAGDLRFVSYQFFPTDESMQMTMSGNTLFYGHWLVDAAKTITNRSASLGSSPSNSIQTSLNSYTIWRQAANQGCTFNSTTRYCSNGLFSFGDTRSYPPGFYEYFNSQNEGSTPYAIVSNNLLLIKTIDGGLMALQSGNPLASTAGPLLAAAPLADTYASEGLLAAGSAGPRVALPTVIGYEDALDYLDQTVTVEGTIQSAVSHLPKAVYLGFTDPHDGALLVRVFNQSLPGFDYDPMTLLGKRIRVTGKITLYWPQNTDPEIVVTDPQQIQIEP
jgi:hypothetical protein